MRIRVSIFTYIIPEMEEMRPNRKTRLERDEKMIPIPNNAKYSNSLIEQKIRQIVLSLFCVGVRSVIRTGK